MNQTYSYLEISLNKIIDDGIQKGFFSDTNKRDLKALDQLAESFQEDATHNDWLNLFGLRNEIADLLNSEMAIHFD